MGNIPLAPTSGQQCSDEAELFSKLDFIEERTVPQLGQAQIFRFKEEPYDYLVRHTRMFDESNPESKTYAERVVRAASMQPHKNIATIHYHKVESRLNNICARSVKVETYCNYYAITLREVISQRKKEDIRFTEGETWYVLKNLVEVSSFLTANGLCYGEYKPQNITLSAEGYIKLYILYFSQATEKNHPYLQALCDRKNISDYLPLPEEFMAPLQRGSSEFTINCEKEDSFYIAMVIMEMLIDEDVRKYYNLNPNTVGFRRDYLAKDLACLKQVYGAPMMDLLAQMLRPCPADRISPSQAAEFIGRNRDELSISGALRMFEDENHQIRPKMSFRTSLDIDSSLKAHEQNILGSKLAAGPIRTFTKKNPSAHKSSLGVSLTSSKKSKDTLASRNRISSSRGSSARDSISAFKARLPR